MFSFMNVIRTVLNVLISAIYSLISVLCVGININTPLPETPENFEPVLRFAVCSDIHINGEEGQLEPERFVKLMNTAYSFSENSSYKNLDALCVAGDFTDEGKTEQYEIFNKCLDEGLRAGTQLVICSGNHEYINYRDVDASEGEKVYKEMLSREPDEHFVINGYHFISISYCDDGNTFKAKKKWLKTEIEKAVADTGDKPIFVFNHPAPFGTIYGSINWGDFSLAEVLTKYPQVVDFSGHSHYPVNDPRSIWQGTFTALGCGTLSYFENELDGIASSYPYSYDKAAQYYIVEVDADGNTRILSYDLITDTFFDNEYYLTGLAKKNYPYSFINKKSLDPKPVFEKSAKISTAVNENGETVLTFDGAKDHFVVESYKISVTENGIKKVFSDNISGKYMFLFENDSYELNLGKLKSGKKYNCQIVAINAYGKLSKPLTYTFTAE